MEPSRATGTFEAENEDEAVASLKKALEERFENLEILDVKLVADVSDANLVEAHHSFLN